MMQRHWKIDAFILLGGLALTLISCNVNGAAGVSGIKDSRTPLSAPATTFNPTDEQLRQMIIADPQRMTELVNRYRTPAPEVTAGCIPGRPRSMIVNGEIVTVPNDGGSMPIDCNFSSSAGGASPQAASTA